MFRFSCGLAVVALIVAAVPLSASAQAPFPNRLIKIVSPAPPGGGTDIIARGVQPILQSMLGQSRNLVVYLLFANVWPVTVARRIDTGIAALLRRLGAMMTAANRSQRCSLASEASAALGAVERDVKLARYEPASVRPTNDWLDVRRRTVNAIAGLMGPLLLHANQDPSHGGEFSGRLGGLAESFAGLPEDGSARGALAAVSDAPNLTDERIVGQLQDLERALALRSADEGAASHAPA